MKLTLKNVRQHKDFTIEIPDSGVILLQGKSGIGKTTILDAIEEAFYGTGSNIPSWGTKKTEVELEWNNPRLHIRRTRGPASLVVIDENGVEHKDDAAQGIINKALGMTEEEFLASSYIKQDSENSLLKYGPADQLRFIEELSTAGFDINGFKKKISEKISSYSSMFEAAEADENTLKYQISVDKKRIDDEILLLGDEPEPPLPEEEYQDCIASAESLSKAIKKAESEIEACGAKLLGSDERERQKKIAQDLAILKDRLTNIEAELNIFGEIEDVLDDTDDKKKTINKIDDQISYIKTKDEIKLLAQKVRELYPESANSNLSVYLQEVKDKKTKTNDSLNTEKTHNEQKLKELSSLKKPQYCPECSSPLAVIGGQIIKTSDVPSNLDQMKEEISGVIKKIASELQTNNTEISTISTILSEAVSLKKRLPASEPVPELKSIDEANAAKEQLSKEISLTAFKLLSVHESKSKLNKMLSDRENIKTKIGELSNSIRDLPDETEIINEQQKLIKIKNSLFENCNQMMDKILSQKNTMAKIEEWQKKNNVISRLKADVELKEAQLAEKNIDTKQKFDLWAAAKRLKELSDFASVQAIERVIDSINASSEEYINKMFSDDGTSIRIKNVSQTKDGKDRAKLSIEIFHKGETASRLSDLSGGEKSRAALAFQLGLAELYNSPILMVDEGFKGLGEDDKVICLEVLRSISGNKLILAVEHGAPESFFDQVVRV